MEFGKVAPEMLSKIDFSFAEEPHSNQRFLTLKQEKSQDFSAVPIYIACPIWANKNWVGSTYPPGTKEKDFLKQYAKQFNSIELNTTHYNIPDPKTIEKWCKEVPSNFKFSPKFLQEISHHLLPRGEAKALTSVFLETIQGFGNHLGRSFLQLPPYFAPNHIKALSRFLDELPPDFELAIEFRHADWFKESVAEQVLSLLENHGVTWVITDVAGAREVSHLTLSNSSTMIRFVGNGLHESDYSRMDFWAKQLSKWLKEGISEIYFFMHQPSNDLAPAALKHFIPLLNDMAHTQVKPPKSYKRLVQGSLF